MAPIIIVWARGNFLRNKQRSESGGIAETFQSGQEIANRHFATQQRKGKVESFTHEDNIIESVTKLKDGSRDYFSAEYYEKE